MFRWTYSQSKPAEWRSTLDVWVDACSARYRDSTRQISMNCLKMCALFALGAAVLASSTDAAAGSSVVAQGHIAQVTIAPSEVRVVMSPSATLFGTPPDCQADGVSSRSFSVNSNDSVNRRDLIASLMMARATGAQVIVVGLSTCYNGAQQVIKVHI